MATPSRKTIPMVKEVFTVTELSTLLNVAQMTLARWRATGRGPAYFRLDAMSQSSPVRYHRSDVAAWINEQKAITAAAFSDNPPSPAAQRAIREGNEGIAKMRADAKARREAADAEKENQ